MKKFFIIFMSCFLSNIYGQEEIELNSCINISQECVERFQEIRGEVTLTELICPSSSVIKFPKKAGIIMNCENCEVAPIEGGEFSNELKVPFLDLTLEEFPFAIKFTGDRSKCYAKLRIRIEFETTVEIGFTIKDGKLTKFKFKDNDGKTVTDNEFQFSLKDGVCDIVRVGCSPPTYKAITNCSSNPLETFHWQLNGNSVGSSNGPTKVINHGPNGVLITVESLSPFFGFKLNKNFGPWCSAQITGDVFLSGGAVGTLNLSGGTLTNVYIASGRGSVRKTGNNRFEYTPPSGNLREKVRICANYTGECGYSCVVCKDIFINWDVKTGDDPIGGGRFGENNDSSSSNLNDNAVKLNISDYKIVYNADDIYLENISKDTKIFLTDIMGRVVYSGNNTNVIPLNNINTGIYFLVLQNNTEKILDTRKVFIP